EFIGGQAGVLGPLVFAALAWAIWRGARRGRSATDEERFLLAYILPPFVLISILAFISRANANWAAVAYPASLILVTGSLFSSQVGRRWLAATVAVNVAMGLTLVALVLTTPSVANQFKGIRTARGWEDTAREIAVRAVPQPGEPPFTAV